MTTTLPHIGCPLCSKPLRFSVATSRRAKKPKAFIMLTCPTDGRHFRAFISDQAYVQRVAALSTGTGTEGGTTPLGSSIDSSSKTEGDR